MKYYELIDVAPDASPEQIKTAYRILVQLHHPDRLQQMSATVREYAEDRLKRINAAYAVLSDPGQRAKYDELYARGSRAAASEDEDDEPLRPARPRRPESERAAARRAYEAWKQEEADKAAQMRARERARRDEAERRETEERIRREAETQFPRVQAQDNQLLVQLSPGLQFKLLRIPAGEFLMGSDPARDPQANRAEQPQHRVHLSEYFIGEHPVTTAEFRVFRAVAGEDSAPVVNVTWDDAAAYCSWLSAATGRAFRLPTEAEWEKAARGADGRLYPWGEAWDASERGSPYGVTGLTGSVWQWCADRYDEKEYARRSGVTHDPLGPDAGEGCLVRGGAFDSSPKHARCAHRNWFYPHNARPNLGFRVAATL